MWASTTSENRRSSRPRSAGLTARHAGKAASARAIAASVSSTDSDGTVATTCSVDGLMTSCVIDTVVLSLVFTWCSQPFESADEFPVGDGPVERVDLHLGRVGVVLDNLVPERRPRHGRA